MLETIRGNLYDYPKYYDLVYGSDWKAEFDFLQECFHRFAETPVCRLLEPACGTGRLLARFAEVGYEVSGLDLNHRAVDYCNRRLQRHGREAAAFVADMAEFRLRRKVDAAFNTINSFRHLPSESKALGHLRCIAASLRRGGLYILGLHLTPTAAQPMQEESWSARRGNLSVLSRLWVEATDLQRRQERIGMSFDVYTPTRQFRILDQTVFRTYTVRQMRRLLAKVPDLAITSVHDFGYVVERETQITAGTEDVVFVLRKC
ncbi:MAG: class I SAM-dependent methyltransferase [Planctomycetota bacterium]